MTVQKRISIAVLISLAALLSACADISGPTEFCPVTGGPGTCPGVAARN